MEDVISRAEYTEFQKRVEEENARQNHRIGSLENSLKEYGRIANSVEKLATNMEGMIKEQEKQGKRLDTLEGRDGEMWRKVVGYVITAVVGIVVGFVFTQIGI